MSRRPSMPWQYSEEYYREYTRTTWNESADAYSAVLARLEPFRTDLLAQLKARRGEQVLDLGTGPGEPALTIAGQVGPEGGVVGVDLSGRMVELARDSARKRGLTNIRFEAMDCADLKLPDASFDAATCCFGFQIFTDPEKAAREARRVLRPDGRICMTVWSTAKRVPFIDVLIGPMLEHAEPDESGYLPTPYETGGPGEMVAFLHSAGFHDGTEQRVEYAMAFENPDDYLRVVLRGTPIGHSLQEEAPEVQEAVLKQTRANLEKWRTPRGLSLPAEALIVTARC